MSVTFAGPDAWKMIATHDDENVKGFFGPYRFLSNFHECQIKFNGRWFPSTENAYQAAKVNDGQQLDFTQMTPSESKRKIKSYEMAYTPEQWDVIKLQVMHELVFQKYLIHEDLRRSLLHTGNKYLEETNWWKDIFWGYDVNLKTGKNYLGRIHMQIRTYWQVDEPYNQSI